MKFSAPLVVIATSLAFSTAAPADIYRWDTGEVIPGTEGIEPGPGVQLDNRNLDYALLAGFDLSDANFVLSRLRNARFVTGCFVLPDCGFDDRFSTLRNANFSHSDMTGADLAFLTLSNANLSHANLTNAVLDSATLTDANFDEATISGAVLQGTTSLGFTRDQLYMTHSYRSKDLRGIRISDNDLSGWDFSGQDLENANFGRWGRGLGPASRLKDASFENANISGANFNGTTEVGFTKEQFYETSSYMSRRLNGVVLSFNDLTGWNLSGQDLSGAELAFSMITDADFSGATLFRTNLGGAVGFTSSQLYVTASYKARRLEGLGLYLNDLTGWNFQGQYLVGSLWHGATLNGADFTAADLRRSNWDGFVTAIHKNTILPDGRMLGLAISSREILEVRDDDGEDDYGQAPVAISIFDRLDISGGGILRLIFESDAWDSIVSFEPDIPVQLNGTLELTFTDDVDVTTQVGRTLHIFAWTGVEPTGAFTVASPYLWDLTNLYSTGRKDAASLFRRHLIPCASAPGCEFVEKLSGLRVKGHGILLLLGTIVMCGPLAATRCKRQCHDEQVSDRSPSSSARTSLSVPHRPARSRPMAARRLSSGPWRISRARSATGRAIRNASRATTAATGHGHSPSRGSLGTTSRGARQTRRLPFCVGPRSGTRAARTSRSRTRSWQRSSLPPRS
jgi:uncharacterized protein YjbI with pentapeptide repeats